MTVREDREVRAPPAMALAGLATAAENVGYTVRDVRAQPGLLLISTPPKLTGASLGFILTVRARRFNENTRMSLDATPLLNPWAHKSADEVLDRLIQEFQLVMTAPKARIRRPKRRGSPERPFGRLPMALALVWATTSVIFFGLLGGGWWWIPAVLGAVGGLAFFATRTDRWWSQVVGLLGLASLPFGLLGLVGRRLARASLLWSETVEPFG